MLPSPPGRGGPFIYPGVVSSPLPAKSHSHPDVPGSITKGHRQRKNVRKVKRDLPTDSAGDSNDSERGFDYVGRFLFVYFSMKLGMQLPHNPAMTALGISPKEMKICIHSKNCTQVSIAALLIIAPWGCFPTPTSSSLSLWTPVGDPSLF